MVRDGVFALAKSLILLLGVPVALGRLWFLSPLPPRLLDRSALVAPSTWSHLAIVIVGVIWAFASANLVREIADAMRHGETPNSTWSARWAIAIAALVVTATASPSLIPAPKGPHPNTAATAPARRRHAPSNLADREVTMAGECLPEFAERVSGCADNWPEIAALNFGRLQPDAGRLLDPARLRGGWQLRIPRRARAGNSGTRQRVSGNAAGLSELALIGLGVVTICALARRVRVLRRRNVAMRRDGEHATSRTRPAASASSAIEPYESAPLLDWIDVANRLLARTIDGRATAPEVRLVRAGPDGVEFLLAQPEPDAPWPFRTEHGGRWWRLDPHLDLHELLEAAEGSTHRYPALVPLGDDEFSSYLVPLRPGRRLGITGDPELVDTALQAIVTGLRVVPWAEQCAIELIGIDAPPATEQCYQLQRGSSAVLGELAEHESEQMTATTSPSTRREPLIVIARDALSEVDDEVLERASRAAGMIVAGRGGTDVIHVDVNGAVLHPYAIAISGVLRNDDQAALVESLLESVTRPPQPVPIDWAEPRAEPEPQAIAAPGAIECRVLRRDPDAIGFVLDPYRGDAGRVVECLAYITLHDGDVAVDAIADALYARSAEPLRHERAENTIAALRSCLGDDASGRPLLKRRGNTLSLSSDASCDWLRAKRAISASTRAEPSPAMELLVAALRLFDGPVCSAPLAGFGWLRADGIADEIEATLTDGAHRLCALALAANDTALARWAVDLARSCSPESEILSRDLMVICDAEGDRQGVRSTFSELESALERLAHNEPSAESRALYEALEAD